ncbi:hypothetical protein [Ligilactobacillus saerimneri]|uniref:hypothetical protein n=1 Tax=Ligilactobacillus saerimneri TaxID=228229 RepID=UPI001C1271CF|nr:hypothetical protein [Ligilactobacillus saerimneri]MBU5309220.1 hypothetical protein [Ligilactobacillus saerimneri]MDI9205851.1 hypothetical protein [Ligilactobacillus saerimneri]
MKLYKWKKGDGVTLIWMAIGALIGLVFGMNGIGLGWPSIDDLLIPAFLIVGFISFIGGIFKLFSKLFL